MRALWAATDAFPAVQLLQLIEERFFLASIVADYRVSITSALPTMYRQSQQILSQRLAEDHPALAYELLTEVTRRADRAPKVRRAIHPAATAVARSLTLGHCRLHCGRACLQGRQRDMLAIVTPWMVNIALTDDATSRSVLHNMFYLTIRFGDEYVTEIEQLWSQLVSRRYASFAADAVSPSRHAKGHTYPPGSRGPWA